MNNNTITIEKIVTPAVIEKTEISFPYCTKDGKTLRLWFDKHTCVEAFEDDTEISFCHTKFKATTPREGYLMFAECDAYEMYKMLLPVIQKAEQTVLRLRELLDVAQMERDSLHECLDPNHDSEIEYDEVNPAE